MAVCDRRVVEDESCGGVHMLPRARRSQSDIQAYLSVLIVPVIYSGISSHMVCLADCVAIDDVLSVSVVAEVLLTCFTNRSAKRK